MKTAAIICEYNPFHSGHLYQMQSIREKFGADTRIVCIMSGSFTQRAEIAIADKSARARMAVLSGANLVLELPFPYSMGSAELFARAGVAIAEGLGCIDILSFGSECGDLRMLSDAAEKMQTKAFSARIRALSRQYPTEGYARLLEIALGEQIGKAEARALLSPNNILALEYLKALKDIESGIEPHTVARNGAHYRATDVQNAAHQSASAIRASILSGDASLLSYVPEAARAVLNEQIEAGLAPCDEEKLSSAVLSHFRLNKPAASCRFLEATGGLYNRLITKSYEAHDISSLAALTETKKFTNARIRRAIWFSFFGVTSSEAKSTPRFTRVLAMDKEGQAILHAAKDTASISIITKPSDDPADEKAREQKALADRADAVFQLTKPKPTDGNAAMRTSPFYKG